MDRPTESWYRFAVGEFGEPRCLEVATSTRAQREVVRQIGLYSSLAAVDEMERELDDALAGKPPGDGRSHGIHSGGADGYSFGETDEHLVVWFQYDCELKGDACYLSEPQGLLLPMREAEPLFRAWIASVRHWRSLGGVHSRHLPADKRPVAYPPPAGS